MLGSRLLLVPAVIAALLLAGCQSAPDGDLEDEIGQIAGVEQVDVDSTRVKATLADDITAADAQTAIVAVRDQAVAGHSLGAQVDLVIVIGAGERDFGGAQPQEVYSFGRWTAGAASGEGFAQQAAFVASLAEWESLLTSPAQILDVQFTATGVDTPGETPDPAESADPAATPDPAATEAPVEPVVQVVALKLRQPYPTENVETDVDALITELEDLWVASGGLPEGITIG